MFSSSWAFGLWGKPYLDVYHTQPLSTASFLLYCKSFLFKLLMLWPGCLHSGHSQFYTVIHPKFDWTGFSGPAFQRVSISPPVIFLLALAQILWFPQENLTLALLISASFCPVPASSTPSPQGLGIISISIRVVMLGLAMFIQCIPSFMRPG